jgi:serine/threonine protein kinase
MSDASSRYRVLRRLGQGGMAEVFEAERIGELGFVRKVAIKQLRADVIHDAMAAQRFIDETRIASQLHHAHIVGVLDVGVLDERPFQVLELIEGLDASELMHRAGGTVPVEIALALTHAVAHALDHAHTATASDGRPLGIVHRDVKPANMLIGWTGDIKLADFGIAVAHDRIAHTETGAVAGTRGFLAPEQRLRGQLDGRSDVFALGVTLHALIAGHTPIVSFSDEIRLLSGEPVTLAASLPDDVRGLIAWAAAPDRLARPTAAQLAKAIGEALAARGARDAREAVRDFVAPLRRPPRAGALDLLLGVEIVPVDKPGTVQRYATEVARPPPPAPPPGPEAAPAPARRTRPIVIAGIASVIAIVGAILVLRPAKPPAPPPPPVILAAIATPPIATPPIAAPPIAAPPIAAPPIAAPPIAAPPIAAPPIATPPIAAPPIAIDAPVLDAPPIAIDAAPDASLPPHRHVTATSSAPPPPPEPPSDSGARGYVQVVGEDLLRARVLIDGVAVGFVPNRFAVRLGHHRVEVERPDGVRLPPREIDVTTFDTAQRPVHPSW